MSHKQKEKENSQKSLPVVGRQPGFFTRLGVTTRVMPSSLRGWGRKRAETSLYLRLGVVNGQRSCGRSLSFLGVGSLHRLFYPRSGSSITVRLVAILLLLRQVEISRRRGGLNAGLQPSIPWARADRITVLKNATIAEECKPSPGGGVSHPGSLRQDTHRHLLFTGGTGHT